MSDVLTGGIFNIQGPDEFRKKVERILEECEQEPSADSKNKQVSYKMRLTLVPRKIIWGIAAAREFGLAKYPKTGRDGWRELSKEAVRDAMMRHMLAYLDDPTGCAEDSKIPHLYHCCCNAAFLCEMENLPLPDKEVMDWWRETYGGNQN